MERKQLDEMDESPFAEEFIEEDIMANKAGKSKKTFRKSPLGKVTNAARSEKKMASKGMYDLDDELGEELEDELLEDEFDDEFSEEMSKAEKFKHEKSGHEKSWSKPAAVQSSKNYSRDIKDTASKDNPKNNPKDGFHKEEVEITSAKSGPSAKSGSAETGKETENKLRDPWSDDDDSGMFKDASTWKVITGIAILLLVLSIFTQGFSFTKNAKSGYALTLPDAEKKTLDFVNTKLLQPPFQAEVSSSEELDDLFRIELDVAGQSFDSYLTKDGRLFFPQGFNTSAAAGSKDEDDSPIVEVAEGNGAVLGSSDAPVTILEFSDFQCPFCKRGYETMKQVEGAYIISGKVRLVFRNFPLSFHEEAKPAALAAACAKEQGEFWKYHDKLFENQDVLGADNYKKWAKELGLDTEKFNNCLESKKYEDEIEADIADGQSYGITGTPAFFVNGRLISGAQPYEVFVDEIEAVLAGGSGELKPADGGSLPEKPTPNLGLVKLSLNAKKWVFTPAELTAQQGSEVELTIVPEELEFTFSIPDLDVEEQVSGATVVKFTPNKAGSFEFKCGSCEDWRGMKGILKVE
ncbi:MAG: thioredoxin domain-containing protein [Nanoarchaeota archaeon]